MGGIGVRIVSRVGQGVCVMKVEPIAGALGALITDVNLAELSADEFAAVREAWLRYLSLIHI